MRFLNLFKRYSHGFRSYHQKNAIEPQPRRLLSCARVNHTWHYIAIQTIWRDMRFLSYTFTWYVRMSPNRQALASCVRFAIYETPMITEPIFELLKNNPTTLCVENRYLSGLEFSRLHTLTIRISITPSSECWVGESKDNYSDISDMDLIPLIECPVLSRLKLWHDQCAIGALPEIWMRYLRRILASLTQSCCRY